MKILYRRQKFQSAVRSDVVVEVLILGQCRTGVTDGEFSIVEVPEFGSGTVIGTLDDAIELRAFGRQDGQGEAECPAGVLELGAQLAAAIDLD